MEIWLRTNARVLLLAMVLPGAVGLVGLVLLAGISTDQSPHWLRGAGAALLALSLATLGVLAWQLRKPRLAYRSGELLVYLRSGAPFRVPIGIVEGFLLGQAPSLLPGRRHQHSETATLVVRLSQRAEEWQHQDVKPQLGKWCEGYITIRGTWCEPLSVALVNGLNQRLAEVSRAVPRT